MLRPRILIADLPPMLAGMRITLGDGVEICAEAADAEQAIRAAHRSHPDLCLVGREIRGDWLGAVRGICRAAPDTAVVVLAHRLDVEDLLEAVRNGAIGYVPGSLDAQRLRNVVAAIGAKEAVIPRSLVLELLIELRTTGKGGSGLIFREAQQAHLREAIDPLHQAITARRMARSEAAGPMALGFVLARGR